MFLLLIFILIFSPIVDAKPSLSKAREKMDQLERKEAYSIISSLIEIETEDAKKEEYIEEINRMSSLFVTDKGQKAFYSSEALYFKNDPQFLLEIKKALSFEKGNLKLHQLKAFYLMRNRQCTLASIEVGAMKKLNPLFPSIKLLELYISLCNKRRDNHKCDLEEIKGTNQRYFHLYQVIACSKEGEQEQLQKSCNYFKQNYSHFPELKIWCSLEKNEQALVELEKSCKKLQKERSKYNNIALVYPFLCDRPTTEVTR